MKLTELEPEFWKRGEPEDGHEVRKVVSALSEAEGIMFLCPKCFEKKGREGTHMILCWFRGKVPDSLSPGPGRWTPEGTGLNDLTFVPGNPKQNTSVKLESGCGAHFLIVNGEIKMC